MSVSIVNVQTDLSDAELAQFVSMIAQFFKKNKDERKRAKQYFPSMGTPAGFLETVLSEGLIQVEAMCDCEEEYARMDELDRMHDAQVFVYGDEHGRAEDGDSE